MELELAFGMAQFHTNQSKLIRNTLLDVLPDIAVMDVARKCGGLQLVRSHWLFHSEKLIRC